MSSSPTATPVRVPAMAWWILALSSLDSVLGMIDRQAVAILKTTLKARFGIDDSEYGVLVTSFRAAYALFFLVCGRLIDRFGSRRMLTIFILIWSTATMLTGIARSFEELIAYRALLGAAEAGLTPATIYALVRWFPREKLATAYGLRGPIVALGPILAPPVVAGLALTLGWHAAFFVPGAVGFVFALAWWFSDRNAPNDEAPRPTPGHSTFKSVLRNRLLWGLVAARMISDPLWFFIQSWLAGYFQEVLGLGLADIGRLLWIPPLGSAVLAIGVGAWSDRMVRAGRNVMLSRVLAMQAVACLAPLAFVIPLVSSVPVAIVLFTLIQVMCLSWLTLSNVLVATLFDKSSVATAAGVLNALGTVGAAVFNFFAGTIVQEYGYGAIFAIAAFLHPAAAVLLYFFYWRRTPRAERDASLGRVTV